MTAFGRFSDYSAMLNDCLERNVSEMYFSVQWNVKLFLSKSIYKILFIYCHLSLYLNLIHVYIVCCLQYVI